MQCRQRNRPVERLLVTGAFVVCFAQAVQASQSPEALIAAARSGLVAARDAVKSELQLQLTRADFVPITDWPGPKTAAQVSQPEKIVAGSRAIVAPFCTNVEQGAVEAAQALAWQVTYFDGKGSLQGSVQTFVTALDQMPDALVAMMVPASLVATHSAHAQAHAHANGITVIAASSRLEKISVEAGHYDAYVVIPARKSTSRFASQVQAGREQ